MLRRLAPLLLLVLPLALAACEKPGASYVTSPSARILFGTTTGNVILAPAEAPPAPVADPPGWELIFDLAVFGKLEDGTPALRTLFEVKSTKGTGFELWLHEGDRTVARWSGGSSDAYDGVVCFQQALRSEDKSEVIVLAPGNYTATLVFRDVERGVVAAKSLKVTGTVPQLTGAAPGPDSKVFRELLGCPRGS
ncbi:MAG: hypothetical protein ACKVVT_11930 [Dehalococcoidia bacterium]